MDTKQTKRIVFRRNNRPDKDAYYTAKFERYSVEMVKNPKNEYGRYWIVTIWADGIGDPLLKGHIFGRTVEEAKRAARFFITRCIHWN